MFKSDVFKTWSLVLQLGISIMVPIFMMVIVADFVKLHFNIDLMLILILIGVLVGVRNVYIILKNYLATMENGQNKESELMKKHLKHLNKNK